MARSLIWRAFGGPVRRSPRWLCTSGHRRPWRPVRTAAEVGRQILGAAQLPQAVEAACQGALGRPGRLFSDSALWSRLALAWLEALADLPRESCLRAAVACAYMATRPASPWP